MIALDNPTTGIRKWVNLAGIRNLERHFLARVELPGHDLLAGIRTISHFSERHYSFQSDSHVNDAIERRIGRKCRRQRKRPQREVIIKTKVGWPLRPVGSLT